MRPLLALALAVVATFGCARENLRLLPGPEDAQAILVAIRSAEAVSVYAGPNVPFALPLDFSGDDDLFVAYYLDRFDELGIDVGASGEVAKLSLSKDGAPVPTPDRSWRRQPDDDMWWPSTAIPDFLRDVRLPVVVRGPCRVLGGPSLHVRNSSDCIEVSTASVALPIPPTPPTPVRTVCLPGREAQSQHAVAVCEPWSPSNARCAVDEIRALPDGACMPIDTSDCAARPVGDRYVDATAGPGGDGSPTAPFADLADAIATGASSISIAAGTYSIPATLTLDRDVTLVGACAGGTRIEAGRVDVLATVRFEQLTIETPRIGVAPSADLTMANTRVILTAGAFTNFGGALTLDRVRLDAATPLMDSVLTLTDGGSASLTDVTVVGAGDVGIAVHNGTNATMNRVVVAGATARGKETPFAGGHGMVVSGSQVTATDLVIERTEQTGLIVADDSRVTLDRAVVRDLGRPPPWLGALGVHVLSRSVLLASDLSIVRASVVALQVQGATTAIDGGVIQEILAGPDQATYAAIVQQSGALRAKDLQVRDTGAQVNVQDGHALLEDFVYDGVRRADGFTHGAALYGLLGGRLDIRRAFVSGAPLAAVAAIHAGTRVTVRDLVAEKPIEHPDYDSNVLWAFESSVLDARRILVTDVAERGLRVQGAEVTLADAAFSSSPDASTETFGLLIQNTNATLERLALFDFTDYAIWGIESPFAVARDLDVRTPTGAGGIAFYAEDGISNLNLRRTRVVGRPDNAPLVDNGRYALWVRHYGAVSIENTWFENIGGRALRLEGKRTSPRRPEARLDVARTMITGTRGLAIELSRDTDVYFDGLTVEKTTRGIDGVRASAVNLAEVNASLRNFWFVDNETTAVRIDIPFSFLSDRRIEMIRGVFDNNDVAFDLPSRTVMGFEFEQIRFVDNDADLRTIE